MGHNDYPCIDRGEGEAKGVYYKGVALTAADFIVIAPTMDSLREKWALFSEQPLNEGKCVEVGLFAQKDIKDTGVPV